MTQLDRKTQDLELESLHWKMLVEQKTSYDWKTLSLELEIGKDREDDTI